MSYSSGDMKQTGRTHSRKKVDLTGQSYGRLTVLGPAENIGARTAWRCRCVCGRELTARTDHLRTGHVTGCGRCVEHPGLTYVDGTCLEILRAKTVRSNNKTGVPGVNWDKAKGRWRASICFKGRRLTLGRFRNFEDAVACRKKAEAELHDAFLEAMQGQ